MTEGRNYIYLHPCTACTHSEDAEHVVVYYKSEYKLPPAYTTPATTPNLYENSPVFLPPPDLKLPHLRRLSHSYPTRWPHGNGAVNRMYNAIHNPSRTSTSYLHTYPLSPPSVQGPPRHTNLTFSSSSSSSALPRCILLPVVSQSQMTPAEIGTRRAAS
jgi:hypothetical protein